jgi:putative oxidoreductase
MLETLTRPYDRAVAFAASRIPESLTLLLVRVALAGIFWRSGRTKVEESSWLSVSDSALTLFAEDPFNKVPLLPTDFAAYLTTYAEHIFPILLVIGLFTRLSALALLAMTAVIQIFVFPEAWWQVHILWITLALVLIVRGGGGLSVDALLAGRRA